MQIEIPYKFEPRPYQKPLLDAIRDGIKRAVYVVHRRGGKDKTCWNLTIREAIKKKGVYFYMLPTFAQAKKVIWDGIDKSGVAFLDHIPSEILSNLNNSEMKIELINGSIIQLVGTDNIDRVVGTNPIGVVFSEFSLMKEAVWEFIRPILAENGGWAVFNFTPRGTNHAWKVLQQAKDNSNWFTAVLSVEDTGAIDKEALDEEKKSMPEDLFQQEFMVKFIEGATQCFKNIDESTYVVENGQKVRWDGIFKDTEDKRFNLGIDLAKYQDFTVITPFDLTTFRVGKQDRFNQIDWNLQKAKIELNWIRHNKPVTRIDGTGLGDPIVDDLSLRMANIESIKFTEEMRNALLKNLQLKLEQGIIKIPYDETLISELKSFQYVLKGNKVRMEVPDNMHDDCVMSLALAIWDIPPTPIRILSKQEKEDLKQFDAFKKTNGLITGSRYLR